MHQAINVEKAANIAIFHNQLSTPQAVRFVIGRAKVDRDKAVLAINNVLTGYKKRA